MAATKVLILLAIVSLLLVNEQEIISLQTLPDSWAGQAGLKPGEVFRDRLKNGSQGPEMIVIPAGKFRMGDIQGKHGKDELPVHQVNFQKAFAASKIGDVGSYGAFIMILFSSLSMHSENQRPQGSSISTTRLNGGSFVTSISVSDDMPNKPKYRVTIESSIFTDYIAILKVIKGKATKAHFDKTTESILKGDVDIRPVRPYYLWLFVFTVIAALLHTYFRIKKG